MARGRLAMLIVLGVLATARGAAALSSDEDQLFALGALLGALAAAALLLSASLIYARTRSPARNAGPSVRIRSGRRFAAIADDDNDDAEDDGDDGDDADDAD